MTSQETIAVFGAGGAMGGAMARNLLAAGYPVRAWNRSREKAEPLAENGATVCDTPAEAATGAAMIITMLSDGDAVTESMSGLEGGTAAPGAVWIQMGTIGEAGTDHCADLARTLSLQFVDAPVSGTRKPAEDGTLVILASGPEDLRPRVAPVFDILGQRTVWAGEAGAGTRLKVAINAWLLAVVEGAAETLALAEGLGLDPQLVLDTVSGGPLDAPYLQLKGTAMIARDFEPQFTLKLAVKDAALAVESADQRDLDLPLLRTVHDRMASAVSDHGDEDLSVTYLASAPRSGLTPPH